MWIFDKILDAYNEDTNTWREVLYNALQNWLARNSRCKNFLPPHVTEEDFNIELLFAIDKIALSDKPRKKKISNMFALSRFIWIWPYHTLWCWEQWKACYLEDFMSDILEDKDTHITEEEMLYHSLYKRWELTQKEYDVMIASMDKTYKALDIAKKLQLSVQEVYAIKQRAKTKIRTLFSSTNDLYDDID